MKALYIVLKGFFISVNEIKDLLKNQLSPASSM